MSVECRTPDLQGACTAGMGWVEMGLAGGGGSGRLCAGVVRSMCGVQGRQEAECWHELTTAAGIERYKVHSRAAGRL